MNASSQLEVQKLLRYLTVDMFLNIGDVTLSLTKLISPAKTAKSCSLDMLEPGKPFASIFKIKKCRGWFPFQVNPEDDDDPNPILAVRKLTFTRINNLELDPELVDTRKL